MAARPHATADFDSPDPLAALASGRTARAHVGSGEVIARLYPSPRERERVVGREDANEMSVRVGGIKTRPPPDRRSAHSRCKASAFYCPRTATEGRLCTLPTASRGEG